MANPHILAWSHRAALAALLLSVGAASGCSVDRRSEAFACTSEGTCPPGRQCVSGWCVEGSPLTDAGDPLDAGDIDAPADPCEAPVCGDGTCCAVPGDDTCSCPVDCGSSCGDGCCNGQETRESCALDCDSCDVCTEGTCTETCGPANDNCVLECIGQCACDFSCADADTCDARCRGGSNCTVSCQDADQCNARCENGSSCTIDCQDADCGIIDCIGGSTCLLQCAGSVICEFGQCTGGIGVMSCPGDIIVCNQPCPTGAVAPGPGL